MLKMVVQSISSSSSPQRETHMRASSVFKSNLLRKRLLIAFCLENLLSQIAILDGMSICTTVQPPIYFVGKMIQHLKLWIRKALAASPTTKASWYAIQCTFMRVGTSTHILVVSLVQCLVILKAPSLAKAIWLKDIQCIFSKSPMTNSYIDYVVPFQRSKNSTNLVTWGPFSLFDK